jgi:LysM repeat protein
MKIPIFSKLTAKSRGRKVVRASARAMRAGEDDYYESEPNMKLSHAFMVVLVLHVVAVGGIYAFNQIKVNKKSDLLANITNRITQATGATAPAPAPVGAAPSPVAPQRQPGDADEPLPVMQSSLPAEPVIVSAAPVVATAAKVDAKAAPPVVSKMAPAKKAPAAKATTYTVAKGDNPYTIAKKFGVSFQDLLKVNGIEDPTKLQIGQVLKVPGTAN